MHSHDMHEAHLVRAADAGAATLPERLARGTAATVLAHHIEDSGGAGSDYADADMTFMRPTLSERLTQGQHLAGTTSKGDGGCAERGHP